MVDNIKGFFRSQKRYDKNPKFLQLRLEDDLLFDYFDKRRSGSLDRTDFIQGFVDARLTTFT